MAPSGGEALYVLVHTPYLRQHHDWSKMLPAYRRRIIDKLKSTAGLSDIEDRIVVERALTPHYGADCPVVVAYRITWPDQKIIRGTLSTIAKLVREAGK